MEESNVQVFIFPFFAVYSVNDFLIKKKKKRLFECFDILTY